MPRLYEKIPLNAQQGEGIRTVTAKLGKSVRSDNLNYKVNSYIKRWGSFLWRFLCDRSDSHNVEYINPNHKHIITGGLRLVMQHIKKLSKLQRTKKNLIIDALDAYIEKLLQEVKETITASVQGRKKCWR